MTKFAFSPQSICSYELTVPQEIICWITMAIATANRVNPERMITALGGIKGLENTKPWF